ncbi:UDP-glucosyltransferase [Lachnellula subtilissima]|uniref:UDP-glucosyltransferase n=1 Tax=Lachnellula subtilissima TaxID=602034 RepID=A0A8H8RL59_9HELO|nr:UDP-glucosyltransferase [Lachnellula subtilissima]
MGSDTKPLVVIGCTPIQGHVMPIRIIAKDLIQRGYEVTIVSASYWRKACEDIGCNFVSIKGYGDWHDGVLHTRWPERNSLPPGPVQLAYDIENCFVKSIPSQHEAMQEAMKMLTEQHPGRPIVQAFEGMFEGGLPICKGAPGIKPTATLGIGVIPMTLSSIDLPPFGPGLPPDTTPEGRERNKAMTEQMQNIVLAAPQKAFVECFEQVGAKAEGFVLDAVYLYPDRFLQMCSPHAEYPRSDAPSSIRFAGGLGKGKRDEAEMPVWWQDVVNNKDKKIVAISQGTLAVNFAELTVPTMEAFKDRDDILVIVALGKKGASLPEDVPIPANARVADFIPFDELLPHSSLFITNGGYGAFQHAISNGTPVIVAGTTEDKPEVATRAEWSGIGINLRNAAPTQEAIHNAAYEILGNPKYKKRAMELEAEMASFDPVGVVAKTIDELAAGVQ